jgi:hypothetical protein
MLALTASLCVDARAAEGGKSLYLLGKRGPLAGLIPKPGWYATNDVYYYRANSDNLVPIGGRVNQGVEVEALVDLLQLTWITDIVPQRHRSAPAWAWCWAVCSRYRQGPRRSCLFHPRPRPPPLG